MRIRYKPKAAWALIFTITTFIKLTAYAYPPAPPYTIEGIVRDNIGDPYGYAGATLELYSGEVLLAEAEIRNDIWLEVNFRAPIAISSTRTPDLYKPTALKPFSPLTARVVVGDQSFLPFKVGGGGLSVGQAGGTGFVELTLGVDSDGDGLPDTWEAWQLSALGLYEGMPGFDLTLIQPDEDSDGDGLSNYFEYIAGTYATLSESRFDLSIIEVQESGEAVLEFLAVIDRKYQIERMTADQRWEVIPFQLEGETETREVWLAPDVAVQRIIAPAAPEGASLYRLIVR